ncbi:DUF5000 domain-containing lipoprotein [Parapedobacter soli]|uniref:DUF5000 domain-containing lipoprotein n=1 Tax=Parapedobacter soli TaxID=416955 RepID=UPI0021CA2C0D|nr:DUF5000 domain-containing lipoprotein [Parapedobacter soli]
MKIFSEKPQDIGRLILYGCVSIVVSLLFSCGSELDMRELSAGDNEAPSNPQVIEVMNLPGSVTISCSPPDEQDVLYLMAEITLNGVRKTVKTSFYDSKLHIDGFPHAGDFDVVIKAVDRNENMSSGITVNVSPTTPSYILAAKSISMVPTFSGVYVTWEENAMKDDLILQLLGYNEHNEVVVLDDYYTDFEAGSFLSTDPSYGYDERPFGLAIQNRWGHASDTTWLTLAPKFDEQLDHKLMSPVRDWAMPNTTDIAEGPCVDVGPNFRNPQTQFSHLFDGNINTYYETGDGVPPFTFTFDLGVMANLSRFRYYQRRGPEFSFLHNTIKRWRVYGSLTKEPCIDDPAWKLLGTYEMTRPSGESVTTQGDIDASQAGLDYFIDIEATDTPVRYIRFAIDENWSQGTMAHFGELMLWGVIVD